MDILVSLRVFALILVQTKLHPFEQHLSAPAQSTSTKHPEFQSKRGGQTLSLFTEGH